MFYPAQAVPFKSCINDGMDRGAPFRGVWPAELSQTKSSVLELPELAQALLTPKKEYGPWGYPTNNSTVVQQLKQMANQADEGLIPTSEDILIGGPAVENLIDQPIAGVDEQSIAVVVADGEEGESDDSSAFVAQSSVRLITIGLLCSAALFLMWSA